MSSRGRPPGRVVKFTKRHNGLRDQFMLNIPTDIAKDLAEKGLTHAVVSYDPITSKIEYLPFSVEDTIVVNRAR